MDSFQKQNPSSTYESNDTNQKKKEWQTSSGKKTI